MSLMMLSQNHSKLIPVNSARSAILKMIDCGQRFLL